MQAKLSQWLGSRATPKTVELLPVDPKGVSEIATPAQYLLEDIMQIAQFHVVAPPKSGGRPSGLRRAEQLAESIV
jgi:hypothetical protein